MERTRKNFLQIKLTPHTADLLEGYCTLTGSKRSKVVERALAHLLDGFEQAIKSKDVEEVKKVAKSLMQYLKSLTKMEDDMDLVKLDCIIQELKKEPTNVRSVGNFHKGPQNAII